MKGKRGDVHQIADNLRSRPAKQLIIHAFKNVTPIDGGVAPTIAGGQHCSPSSLPAECAAMQYMQCCLKDCRGCFACFAWHLGT